MMAMDGWAGSVSNKRTRGTHAFAIERPNARGKIISVLAAAAVMSEAVKFIGLVVALAAAIVAGKAFARFPEVDRAVGQHAHQDHLPRLSQRGFRVPEIEAPKFRLPERPGARGDFDRPSSWSEALEEGGSADRQVKGTVDYLFSDAEKRIVDTRSQQMNRDQIESEVRKGIEKSATENGKPAWLEIELPKGDLTITKDLVVGGVRIKASKVNIWRLIAGSVGLIYAIEKCKSDDVKAPSRDHGMQRAAEYRAWQLNCESQGGSCEPFHDSFDNCIMRAFSDVKNKIVNLLTTEGAEEKEKPK
jgi:hypothetical protein